MNIQQKLKLIKQITGQSQEVLAREIGVSFVTLNSWFNARSVPRRKFQARIDGLLSKLTGGRDVKLENPLEAKKGVIREYFRKKYSKGRFAVVKFITSHKDIYDQYILSLTYNTNRIEGSTLTETETAAILFDNIAPAGKSIVEQLEAKNHQTAIQYLFKILLSHTKIDLELILKLHSILMNSIREDAGVFRNHGVRIVGSNVATANYLKVQTLMNVLVEDINREPEDFVKHVTEIHSRFEQIHPFSDGNGRIGRLLICAMLLSYNICPAVIKQEYRKQYLSALQEAQLYQNFFQLEDLICDALFEGIRVLERK